MSTGKKNPTMMELFEEINLCARELDWSDNMKAMIHRWMWHAGKRRSEQDSVILAKHIMESIHKEMLQFVIINGKDKAIEFDVLNGWFKKFVNNVIDGRKVESTNETDAVCG